MSFDLEWTIIMHLYRNGGRGKKHVIYELKKRMEDAFPTVHFHFMPDM